MEELFRFNITRPATRSNAATLVLGRNSRQASRDNVATGPNGGLGERLQSIASESPNDWARLVPPSLEFVENYAKWIATPAAQPFQQLLAGLTSLLDALQLLSPDTLAVSNWPSNVDELVDPFEDAPAKTQLAQLEGILADLFLALLIIRADGPSKLARLIRDRNEPPDVAQLLYGDPSLTEIGDLLRLIDLLLTDPAVLNAMTADDVHAALTKTLELPEGIFSKWAKPVHPVGWNDLYLVKQHIDHYDLGEIARIENILKGESRAHAQKHTLSNERDIFVQTETTTETDQELTSTDHVKMSNEVENVLKEDTKVDGGLHVQYDGGGSYKVQADLTAAYDRSSSESKKFASEISKDVTAKAAKKVTQRITQSQTTKIIETFEEDENQSFDNKGGTEHISGVYQWIEKVYRAQVFNYGWHWLFDIMVPEPAASLLAASHVQPKGKPVPPDPLGTIKVHTDGNKQLDQPLRPDWLVDAATAGKWIAQFQVTGVEPPPTQTITVTKAFAADARDTQHRDITASDNVNLLDGYVVQRAKVSVGWKAFTDHSDEGQVNVQVGNKTFSFNNSLIASGNGHQWANSNYSDFHGEDNLDEERGAIGFTIRTSFIDLVSVNIEVSCIDPELFPKWQLQTYEKIVTRWQKLQDDYEAKLGSWQFQQQQVGILGSADPEANRQRERTELKRACIAILDNSRTYVDGITAVTEWSPPQDPSTKFLDPDLPVAEDNGAWVRWFEQAFEWDKIGYIFYPYYWGRSSEWIERLNLKHDDPLFLNFLQAGYARVVIPVRNGFEPAVQFYLCTGKPWMGGGLPTIWAKGHNPLYLSMVEEMKEQTGAPGNEVPVGDPWYFRLPTTLIKLRKDDKSPNWQRVPKDVLPPADTWTWQEFAKAWDDGV